ncbi:universal stress protein [Aquibaculum arenosum]|uniref:Universal stress protein n=1 Tax=Aquibaculum arenosum TaxID=3032591 RepID=A0ABT5YL76_9PROT|nr:universal stress protein [Fodinicurvata sp. CAU 1616]MDF2095530.1 universal stress protein [Fodinicurvata sp. CAU 1616]
MADERVNQEPAGDERAEGEPKTGEAKPTERVMLVVVDDSLEMPVALRYACRRARHAAGRVALLHVIERTEFQTWLGVGDLMAKEAREQAERLMQRVAKQVMEQVGNMPILYLREGKQSDELMRLISEEPSISILILGANTDPGGPGPLVSALTGKMVGKLRIPVTIVPGNLSSEDIDAIS